MGRQDFTQTIDWLVDDSLAVPKRQLGRLIAGTVIFLLLACGIGAVLLVKSRSHQPSMGAAFRENRMFGNSHVFTDAVASFSDSSSVRIRGNATINGTLVTVDAVVGVDNGGGTVSIGPLSYVTVLNGTDLYIKANALTWKQIGYGTQADRLAGRWVRTSAYLQPFSNFDKLMNIGFFASLFKAVPNLVEGPTTTLDGMSVIPLRPAHGTGETFYVTATGNPVLVAEGDKNGLMRFDDYGTADPPAAPTSAVDLGSVLPSQEQ